MRRKVWVLTYILCAVAIAAIWTIGRTAAFGDANYDAYLSNGAGNPNYFGPGVGYGAPSGQFGNYENQGDYFRRYVPPGQWGNLGNGTGHLGEGYGPYIYSPRNGPPPPGINDPLPGTFSGPPPPRIKVAGNMVKVCLPKNMQGVRQVTVTLVAFNGADLVEGCIQHPPWIIALPVMDGIKTVRIRVDYCNNGLSATSYPL